jgi:hypothetical protein
MYDSGHSSMGQRHINCSGIVFVMCNVLPPSLSSPRKVQQMKETLLQFETPSCCNQKSTPVLNGLLKGDMNLLNGFIHVHIEV